MALAPMDGEAPGTWAAPVVFGSTNPDSAYGLILGTGGAVTAVGVLLDTAIRGFATEGTIGHPWWRSMLEALVWAAGGALVWWWHWVRGGVRLATTGWRTLYWRWWESWAAPS